MTTYGLYGLPEPERPPRPPSKWRWPVRIIGGLIFCILLTLFLLSRQGGSSDSLKQFLQNYISDSTGYQAEIGTLNALSFYPVLGVDLDDLVLRRRSDQEIMARFDHLNLSVGFLSAALGQSAIRTFSIENGMFAAGMVTPKEIKMTDFRIRRDDPDAPALVLRGEYGGQAMTASADLLRKTNMMGASSFILADDKKLTLEAGPIKLDSILGIGQKGQRAITILSLETGKNIHPLKGRVEIARGLHSIYYSGNLRGGATHLDFDIESGKDETRKIGGRVDAVSLDPDDVFGPGGMMEAYNVLADFYGAAEPDTLPQEIDLRFLEKGKAAGRIEATGKGWAGLGGRMTIMATGHDVTAPLKVFFGSVPAIKGKELNCGIGDFVLENGVVNIRTLFLDFPDRNLTASGTLHSVPKPSLTASSPDAAPHDLQPAYGLSALGLDAQHPCKAYLTP